MTKTNAKEIKSAHVLSASPLLIQVVYTSGGSDTFTPEQMDRLMTLGAQKKTRELAGVAA